MLLTDVCRLCLARENLVWIFDKRFENSQNMKDVIFTTTGVEIHTNDVISQKICKKCCEIAVKMLQFRSKSLENDLHLKELFNEYLKNGKVKVGSTPTNIRSEATDRNKGENNVTIKSSSKLHTSIQNIFKNYPQIKIPSKCLKFHMDPHVFMTLDSVENYFIERNMNMNKHIRLALRCNKEQKERLSVVQDHISVDENETISKQICTYNKTDIRASSSKEKSCRSRDVEVEKSSDEINKNVPTIKPNNIEINAETSSGNFIEKKVNQQDSENCIKKLKPTVEISKSSLRQQNISEIDEKLQRKLSETVSMSCEIVNKAALVQPLKLIKKTSDNAETMYVDKSVPLHICDICNSVQYNAKDLKKHQYKHLRCQFCKTKFRTLELKMQHLSRHCPIKNIMNNLPSVILKKIELDAECRVKYRNAFVNFPPLPVTEVITNNVNDMNECAILESKQSASCELMQRTDTAKKRKHTMVDNSPMEVIEILSDDDGERKDLNQIKSAKCKRIEKKTAAIKTLSNSTTNLPVISASTTVTTNCNSPLTSSGTTISNCLTSTSTTVCNGANFPLTSINVTTSACTRYQTSASTTFCTRSNSPLTNASTTCTPVATNNKNLAKSSVNTAVSNTCSVSPNISVPLSNLNAGDSIVYSTVSIVKPDVKIKNIHILDKFDSKTSDINVMKELLSAPKLLNLMKEASMQTSLPTNNGIVTNLVDHTTELTFLKQQLHTYKIPVKVKNGLYNVSYTYEKPADKQKKIYLWNDLTPIDIKLTKTASISKTLMTVSCSFIAPPKVSIGPQKQSVNCSKTVSVISNINVRDDKQKHVTSAPKTTIPQYITPFLTYAIPNASTLQDVNSSAPPISTSTINMSDKTGQHASGTVTVHPKKLAAIAPLLNKPLLNKEMGIRLGQIVATKNDNHQNKLLVPVTAVASPPVVMNGTLNQNVSSTFTVSNPNQMQSSVSTPLFGNVRPDNNMTVTYKSNLYNFNYTTPITTSTSIPNISKNLPPIPVNSDVSQSNPIVLNEPSNNCNIPSNLVHASNINYISNNVSENSSSLVTNEINPKPGFIRVKNVWELK